MRINIDEAGNFVASADGQSLFSLVLAVIVPSSIEAKLFDEFSRVLGGWTNETGEIKGSKLDESQAAQVVQLVSRYDVFVKFSLSTWRHMGTMLCGNSRRAKRMA